MSFIQTAKKHPTKNRYQPWSIIGLVFLLLLTACGNQQQSSENLNHAVNKAKIEVKEDGFYRITEKELEKAGISFDTFSADTLELTSMDISVPFYFDENGLAFYGQAPTSRYTASRPYILTVGNEGVFMSETAVSQPSAALPTLDTITKIIHLEENLLYESQARSHNEDNVWFWETIRQGNSFPISFELPAVADGSGQVTIELVGVSYNVEVENDHDFEVIINKSPVGTVQFDGAVPHTAVLDIPPGTLQTGQNELILDNSAEGAAFLDIMLLNWFELAYDAPITAVHDQLFPQPTEGTLLLAGFSDTPLLFDISEPSNPHRLIYGDNQSDAKIALEPDRQLAAVGPKGFQAPYAINSLHESNWRDTSQQADLIILTTNDLAPTLAPLVEAREAEGLNVKVVPVEEIYDEFGGGEASPDSLKLFLAHAYENWQAPQPAYLLLVGDATSDYHNYLGLAPQNVVPAPLVAVSHSGETVSDSLLADVDNDGIPEMAVGRWPVNTAAEAADLVARTLAYEKGTPVNTTLFAVDGTEPQFKQMAQSIASHSRLPEEGLHILNGPQASEVAAALNDGAWLATYIGHGSLRQWGKDDVFTQEAITSLNSETPPILLQLTCLTGLFTQPEQTSLTEMLLTHETGPVLSVAATSLTYSSNQEPFATSLIQQLNDPAVERIGDAFQAAKLSLDIENEGLREISDTFALFGDPSARIIRPET